MTVFVRSSHLPVSLEEAFAWHERPGAEERLFPYWEEGKILHKNDSIKNSGTVDYKIKFGLVPVLFSIKYQNYTKNKLYEGVQNKGPFSYWKHTHLFESLAERSKITDQITYKLPFHLFSQFAKDSLIEERLDKLFAYRHRTLSNDLFLHARYSKKKLKILVTGASGFVGSELVPFLTSGGHQVIRLSRSTDINTHSNTDFTNTAIWDSSTQHFCNPEILEGIDAVIHLAGENIASQKWTQERKQQLITSRVYFTKSLCKALAILNQPPKIFIAASGIGIYGDRDYDDLLTEDSKLGEGFLAKLAKDWEDASQEATKFGARVVNLRFGAIVSLSGGVLKKLHTPFKLYAGSTIGSGKQLMPWISMVDVLGLILFSLSNNKITGPLNAVSPNNVTNLQFAETLGQTLNRPSSLKLPEVVVDALFGEMGKELLLYSQNAKPLKALKAGYEFLHTELHDAMSYYLGV